MRPSSDTYFMDIARTVATRATCLRKHVGAVIVRDKTILSTGYNGSIRGMPHCDDPGVGCLMEDGHCTRTVHAEANAILQAAKNGVAIDGAILYSTASPCWPCFGLIANSGIRRIVFGEAYRAGDPGPKRVAEIAKLAGIELVSLAAPHVEIVAMGVTVLICPNCDWKGSLRLSECPRCRNKMLVESTPVPSEPSCTASILRYPCSVKGKHEIHASDVSGFGITRWTDADLFREDGIMGALRRFQQKPKRVWDSLIDALDDLAKKYEGKGKHDRHLGVSLHAISGLAKDIRRMESS